MDDLAARQTSQLARRTGLTTGLPRSRERQEEGAVPPTSQSVLADPEPDDGSHLRSDGRDSSLPRLTADLQRVVLRPIRAKSNDRGDALRLTRSRTGKETILNRKVTRAERQPADAGEATVCRICLGEEDDGTNPLISPCKCAGTMSHIHLACLREWLNSKRTKKESKRCQTYCWKTLECELCKARFPAQLNLSSSVAEQKAHPRQRKKAAQPIQVLEYDTPDSEYLVLESVTLQNIRIIHVLTISENEVVRIGRGHEAEIRVTDISVSRLHAKISKNADGEYFVEDNNSKFGTLIQVRKPIVLSKAQINYIQMGRTFLKIRITDLETRKRSTTEELEGMLRQLLCCFKAQKELPKVEEEEPEELYPAEWDEQPLALPCEPSLAPKIHDFDLDAHLQKLSSTAGRSFSKTALLTTDKTLTSGVQAKINTRKDAAKEARMVPSIRSGLNKQARAQLPEFSQHWQLRPSTALPGTADARLRPSEQDKSPAGVTVLETVQNARSDAGFEEQKWPFESNR